MAIHTKLLTEAVAVIVIVGNGRFGTLVNERREFHSDFL